MHTPRFVTKIFLTYILESPRFNFSESKFLSNLFPAKLKRNNENLKNPVNGAGGESTRKGTFYTNLGKLNNPVLSIFKKLIEFLFTRFGYAEWISMLPRINIKDTCIAAV